MKLKIGDLCHIHIRDGMAYDWIMDKGELNAIVVKKNAKFDYCVYHRGRIEKALIHPVLRRYDTITPK